MKDLGTISHFLGIDFVFEKDEISMSQARYIEKLLERFSELKLIIVIHREGEKNKTESERSLESTTPVCGHSTAL